MIPTLMKATIQSCSIYYTCCWSFSLFGLSCFSMHLESRRSCARNPYSASTMIPISSGTEAMIAISSIRSHLIRNNVLPMLFFLLFLIAFFSRVQWLVRCHYQQPDFFFYTFLSAFCSGSCIWTCCTHFVNNPNQRIPLPFRIAVPYSWKACERRLWKKRTVKIDAAQLHDPETMGAPPILQRFRSSLLFKLHNNANLWFRSWNIQVMSIDSVSTKLLLSYRRSVPYIS